MRTKNRLTMTHSPCLGMNARLADMNRLWRDSFDETEDIPGLLQAL
ncbi:hypothetical protein PM3016_4070 [Paenibacillus mucilaginosus 3016]|uniref:Uncharacterized protein n=1 Tax=Paenibacillus mucilaginosus 3016 TaxID=1116391 RepID=H6NK01_9BACL|nr:hypothetical protein PM3016_4070 [Paenibacillus mucilaginosus 3016]